MEQTTTTSNSVDLFQKVHSMAAQRAAKIEAIGFYPYYTAIEENHGSRVIIDGRELIMIGSNNYLGLSWDPRVIEAAIETTRRYGTSCSGSRFLNGTLRLHEELEAALAEFAGKPAALSFTTGYQTNLGAIQALSGRHDHVFSDRLNHGSLVDGILLAAGTTGGTRIHRYQHNDLAELERLLNTVDDDGGKLIVTDGVFSMEGDIAPLPEIGALARQYGARVYLRRGARARCDRRHRPRLSGTLRLLRCRGRGDVHVFQVVRRRRRASSPPRRTWSTTSSTKPAHSSSARACLRRRSPRSPPRCAS